MKSNFISDEKTLTAELHASKVVFIVKAFLFALIAILVMILKG